MSKQYYLSIILSAVLPLLTFSQKAEYLFEINLPEYANEEIMLAYYYGETVLLQDRIKLNKVGSASYAGMHHEGIYLVVLPDSVNYEFLISASGSYTLTRQDKSLHIQSNPAGEAFAQFQLLSLNAGLLLDSLRLESRQAEEPFRSELGEEMRRIKTGIDITLEVLSRAHAGSLAGNYFKALLPVEIPESLAADSSLSDSLRWMKRIHYYRDHYLDNVDWSDPGMIYTPVAEARVITYLDKLVPPITNEQSQAIDRLLAYSQDARVKEFLIKLMLNKYANSLNDPVYEYAYLYLADHYLLKNPPSWLTEDHREKLKIELARIRPTSLGSVAPEINLQDKNHTVQSLHTSQADAFIILFWDYSCPGCNRLMDDFRKIVDKYHYKNILVYTVFVGDDREVWEAWVEKRLHPDWINTVLEGRNDILKAYALARTPTIFLLNSKQEIMDKALNVRELDEYLFKLPY